MKIKKSCAVLLTMFAACSFTCSEVFASGKAVDDMAALTHRPRKRHNAVVIFKKEPRAQFIAYKEENAVFAAAGMKKITINNGVRIIDRNAFFDRDDIDEVVIPRSVEIIDDYAFVGCKNLKKIVIKGEVSIGEFSFLSCKNLVEIYIEGNIKNLLRTSFFECNNLGIIRTVGHKHLSENVVDILSRSRIRFDEFGNQYSCVTFFNH